MRAALATGLLAAAALLPRAAQAGEPGLFCLDRAELAAERDKASPAARQLIYNEQSSFGALLAGYERMLQSAERGDAVSQRRIGGYWAACVLAGDGMSAQKQATAVSYLQPAAGKGDKQAQRYLAQFHALGAGVPADYGQAYKLLVDSGYPADTAAKTATRLKLTQSTPSEQQALAVFGVVLSAMLKERLEALSGEVVRKDAAGQLQNVRTTVHTCPNRVEIQQADPGIDRPAMLAALQALLQRLPSQGLPCKDDSGQAFGFALPFSIQR